MKIIFLGDSITDSGRLDKEDLLSVGGGYVSLIKAELEYDDASVTVYNEGMNGSRIADVYARLKRNCINTAPDVVTILIGVNDAWHDYEWGSGISEKDYEKLYHIIIDDIKEDLPETRIILMGSYLLHGGCTDDAKVGFDKFFEDVANRRRITQKVAKEYNLEYIDLQEEFERHITSMEDHAHWSADGVHPSSAGHELIKRAWLKKFRKIND